MPELIEHPILRWIIVDGTNSSIVRTASSEDHAIDIARVHTRVDGKTYFVARITHSVQRASPLIKLVGVSNFEERGES